MFGRILLLVLTLMHVYVFWRAASVPFLTRHVPRKFIFGAGVLLWAVFYLGRFVSHGSSGPLASVIEFAGMIWMAVAFLLTVCLLFVDVLTGFGHILSRHAPLLRGYAFIAGAMLSSVALVQGLRAPVVESYDVHLTGLSPGMEGTVIVAMSDLHIGSQIGIKWLEDRVEQAAAQKADIIVLLGDIFEGHDRPGNEIITVLSRLSAPLGVWAVLGNHEYLGRNNTGPSILDFDGVKVLNNTWAEVAPSLVFAGVDDLTTNHRTGKVKDPVSLALAGRPPGATILLSHTPWFAERIAAEGVGLMLSGHTHGGQIWPFGYLVQRIYPLLSGQYEVDNMTVIVCRGTGTWGPRMRLWRPGEILRVTLHAKSSQ